MLSYTKCLTDLGVYPKGKAHHLIFCPMNIQFVQSGSANNNFKIQKVQTLKPIFFFLLFSIKLSKSSFKKDERGKIKLVKSVTLNRPSRGQANVRIFFSYILYFGQFTQSFMQAAEFSPRKFHFSATYWVGSWKHGAVRSYTL